MRRKNVVKIQSCDPSIHKNNCFQVGNSKIKNKLLNTIRKPCKSRKVGNSDGKNSKIQVQK